MHMLLGTHVLSHKHLLLVLKLSDSLEEFFILDHLLPHVLEERRLLAFQQVLVLVVEVAISLVFAVIVHQVYDSLSTLVLSSLRPDSRSSVPLLARLVESDLVDSTHAS
jgi:hypothetical protein